MWAKFHLTCYFSHFSAKRFIPSSHECIQILHHALVYELDLVLLLIGDKKRSIVRGIWVSFNEEIMASYEAFLARCYEESLKWAYENEEGHGNARESSHFHFINPFLPKGVDFESFLDFFHLWNQSSNSTTSRLPIPPNEKIIPYHFATWNKLKRRLWYTNEAFLEH